MLQLADGSVGASKLAGVHVVENNVSVPNSGSQRGSVDANCEANELVISAAYFWVDPTTEQGGAGTVGLSVEEISYTNNAHGVSARAENASNKSSMRFILQVLCLGA